jgi:hypothetical protein
MIDTIIWALALLAVVVAGIIVAALFWGFIQEINHDK